MTKPPRDYDAELADLLKIIHEHSEGIPSPYAPPAEDAGACMPILAWVVEHSQEEEERENAHP